MRKILFFLLLSLSLQALTLKDEKGQLIPAAKEFVALFGFDPSLPLEQLTPLLKEEWLNCNQERWEIAPRFDEKSELAFPLLEQIGCIHKVEPTQSHYTYALVLGSLGKAMERRLNFLYEQWDKGVRFDQIILLTGDRDLDPLRELFPEGLKNETDLFVYLFENHPLKHCVPYTVIDSPKQFLKSGEFRRPTTASTVIDWLKTMPKPGSCLAVSTQPFVGYQEAVLRYYLPSNFTVEGIGPGTQGYPTSDLDLKGPSSQYPLSVYLDNFAKWLIHEHILEYQCEKLSSKSLSDPPWRDRVDTIETAYRSN